MCGRVGSAKKMQKVLQECYKLISIWIKKFPGGKKYFTKIKRADALFFVYNYYLTKPHKCGIINLDPPLGGRRSRNSHYTISFKKSQIKSSRRIAQSFFPKSLFFVQSAQPASAGVPQLSPHMRPLLFGSPGPGAYARRAGRKLAPQKFFLPVWRPARRVNFPIWPRYC